MNKIHPCARMGCRLKPHFQLPLVSNPFGTGHGCRPREATRWDNHIYVHSTGVALGRVAGPKVVLVNLNQLRNPEIHRLPASQACSCAILKPFDLFWFRDFIKLQGRQQESIDWQLEQRIMSLNVTPRWVVPSPSMLCVFKNAGPRKWLFPCSLLCKPSDNSISRKCPSAACTSTLRATRLRPAT